PMLEPIIKNIVSRMTYITFKASRLTNLYVLYFLNTNQSISNLDYNHFMRLPFQAVLKEKTSNIPKNTIDIILNNVCDNLYAPLHPANLMWNDESDLGQIISSIARLYAINSQNHVI
ncbi:13227_t:CDS:2, partial [Racocetra persica]